MKWLLLALAACDAADPCAGHTTCIELDVNAQPGAAIDTIDELEVDILAGSLHATVTTPTSPAATKLPLETAIAFDGATESTVGIVVAGMLTGSVLGTAATTATLDASSHTKVVFVLAPPIACVAQSKYCGGDKVAGDASTLYECVDNGVPEARGHCPHGCMVNPGANDACAGGSATCVSGEHYCGGDSLDGDPSELYLCTAGMGVSPQVCPNGCAAGACR